MKVGRNDPCHCGSGLKYKKCHLAKDEADHNAALAAQRAAAAAAAAAATEAAPEGEPAEEAAAQRANAAPRANAAASRAQPQVARQGVPRRRAV